MQDSREVRRNIRPQSDGCAPLNGTQFNEIGGVMLVQRLRLSHWRQAGTDKIYRRAVIQDACVLFDIRFF